MAEPHDILLDHIRSRSEKQTEFNFGILTGDRYVKTMKSLIGMEACYKHMCRTGGEEFNFDDMLQKASEALTYSSPDMVVKKKKPNLPIGIEAPKNTLMVFRHVLTTSKKDRDGDILRTGGATVDPKMLLLWQHVHTLPIGKMLAVASHTKDELQLFSCIIDMNELCHDAAVMVDNDMGRLSHGFRALDFLEIKAGREGDDSPGGYDVKRFEILEESLVSVPANPDAETQEVIVSLVEGGKLTSGLMKDCAQVIRKQMPLSVPVQVDLKVLVNGQEVKGHENKSRDEEGGEGTEPGASKEAGTVPDEGKENKGSEDKEVKKEQEKKALADDSESGGSEAVPPKPKPKVEEEEGKEEVKMTCPDCDYEGPGKEGKCPKCGAKLVEPKPEAEKNFVLEKLGRVLSKANESKLKDAMEDVAEVLKMDITRPAKALLGQAKRGLGEVVASMGIDDGMGKDVNGKIGVKQAMAIVLTDATKDDLVTLKSLLQAFEKREEAEIIVKQFSECVNQ